MRSTTYRLGVAPAGATPSRYVVERIFRHAWAAGGDPLDPARLQALQDELQPLRDPSDPSVKSELRVNTESAVAAGIFGVPTVSVDGRNFWGHDGLDPLSEHLRGNPWFSGPAWDDAGRPRDAIRRG